MQLCHNDSREINMEIILIRIKILTIKCDGNPSDGSIPFFSLLFMIYHIWITRIRTCTHTRHTRYLENEYHNNNDKKNIAFVYVRWSHIYIFNHFGSNKLRLYRRNIIVGTWFTFRHTGYFSICILILLLLLLF